MDRTKVESAIVENCNQLVKFCKELIVKTKETTESIEESTQDLINTLQGNLDLNAKCQFIAQEALFAKIHNSVTEIQHTHIRNVIQSFNELLPKVERLLLNFAKCADHPNCAGLCIYRKITVRNPDHHKQCLRCYHKDCQLLYMYAGELLCDSCLVQYNRRCLFACVNCNANQVIPNLLGLKSTEVGQVSPQTWACRICNEYSHWKLMNLV